MFCVILFIVAVSACSTESEDKKANTNLELLTLEKPNRFTFYEDFKKEIFEVKNSEKEVYEFKVDLQKYKIIVATLTAGKRASELSKKLIKEGFITNLNNFKRSNGVELYRVEVGPYKGKRETRAIQNQLASLGFVGTYIINYDTKNQ
jgi:hypothetical protein